MIENYVASYDLCFELNKLLNSCQIDCRTALYYNEYSKTIGVFGRRKNTIPAYLPHELQALCPSGCFVIKTQTNEYIGGENILNGVEIKTKSSNCADAWAKLCILIYSKKH